MKNFIIVSFASGVAEEFGLSLDTTVPNTKEEFELYGNLLTQKLNLLAKHSEFSSFAEQLIKSIAINCEYIIYSIGYRRFL